MYTIGRLAQRARINADSIRFYERQGLLAPANKTDSGYRLYTDEAVRRIAFIKHAQRCGFSLAEISALLQMHTASAAERSDAYRLAAQKQAEIRATIESLNAMAAALDHVLSSRADDRIADSKAALGQSPLLSALEEGLSQQGSNAASAGRGAPAFRAPKRLAA